MPLPELPSPIAVANRCARRAWKHGIADKDRYLHEASADTIRILIDRNYRLARLAEHHEADAALMFQLHYGPQRGGAA